MTIQRRVYQNGATPFPCYDVAIAEHIHPHLTHFSVPSRTKMQTETVEVRTLPYMSRPTHELHLGGNAISATSAAPKATSRSDKRKGFYEFDLELSSQSVFWSSSSSIASSATGFDENEVMPSFFESTETLPSITMCESDEHCGKEARMDVKLADRAEALYVNASRPLPPPPYDITPSLHDCKAFPHLQQPENKAQMAATEKMEALLAALTITTSASCTPETPSNTSCGPQSGHPLSPETPETPTPTTKRRHRYLKLTRTLGEPIPPGLVPLRTPPRAHVRSRRSIHSLRSAFQAMGNSIRRDKSPYRGYVASDSVWSSGAKPVPKNETWLNIGEWDRELHEVQTGLRALGR